MLLRRLLPRAALGVGVGSAGACVYAAASGNGESLRAHAEASIRACRLAACCAQIASDYKAAQHWLDEESDDIRALQREHNRMQQEAGAAERVRATTRSKEAERHAQQTRKEATKLGEQLAALRLEHASDNDLATRWSALHTTCAQRLLAMCMANGGVYVKLGQHLAQLDYIVPEPYIRTLAALFEHNAPSPPEAIHALIETELGARADELYERFDETPIASASLAQVHVAYERATGRKVAVKCQHPRLREASKADMAAVALAVKAASWLFADDFRLAWILDELAPHLPLELDFEHEAENLERCRAFFAPGGEGASVGKSVVLPEVFYGLSSKRVLTMSFEEGVRVTDSEGLDAMGAPPSAVTRLLSECFCSLVFRGHFVHADPHPGNVLVRRVDAGSGMRSGTQFALVLLDHGLYRELPAYFTHLYAQLWQSVLMGDADGIRRVSFELGVGEYYPLLAAMLTGRPWGDILSAGGSQSPSRLAERGTAEDKAQIRGYAQQYLKQIVKIMELVPAPMLLIFKTNDCLRHIERQLLGQSGGGESFVIMLRYCVHALLHERMAGSNSFVVWLLRVCLDGAQGLGLRTFGALSRALSVT